MSKKADDEETYKLTEWGCLKAVLLEYGIDVSHISDRVGRHIVEDFMECLIERGYVVKNDEM